MTLALERWLAPYMPDVILDLPLPPSVNRNRRIDWGSYGDYIKWQKNADKCLMLHKQNKQAALATPYQIIIEVDYAVLQGDLDNILKALIDYCVTRGLVPDDRKRFLKEITMRFATEPLAEGCRVTLRAI